MRFLRSTLSERGRRLLELHPVADAAEDILQPQGRPDRDRLVARVLGDAREPTYGGVFVFR